MKKILNITALVLCVAVVIGMGISSLADASIDRISPNFGYSYPLEEEGKLYGYVQIQPSYNDNGKHAQVGRGEFISADGRGNACQTAVGTHEGDSRILSAYCTFQMHKDSSGKNYYTTVFRKGYIYQPHTGDPTRPWAHPFSFSPIENLVEPKLMK